MFNRSVFLQLLQFKPICKRLNIDVNFRGNGAALCYMSDALSVAESTVSKCRDSEWCCKFYKTEWTRAAFTTDKFIFALWACWTSV